MLLLKDGINKFTDSLDDKLETYYMVTGINVLAIDKDGKEACFHGKEIKFCEEFIRITGKTCDCKRIHLEACKKSTLFGEPYFFLCPLNLLHITVPIFKGKEFEGGIVAGPIVMNTPGNQLHMHVMEESGRLKEDPLLENYLNAIPVIDCTRANYIGNFLYMLSSMYNKDILCELKHRRNLEARINESIRLYKENSIEDIDMHDMESELFRKVKQGNLKDSNKILDELMVYIYVSEGRNIESIKNRCIELYSLISRAALEGGAQTQEIFAFNNLLQKDLNNLRTIDSISKWMLDALSYYVESIITISCSENEMVIKKAIKYMNGSFKEFIKLEDVANLVHLNPSYFSTLFKKETGMKFVDYLLELKIEESKHMLINTDESILDIAMASGFNSQSYFTRAFKKNTGMTPKQFKSSHHI